MKPRKRKESSVIDTFTMSVIEARSRKELSTKLMVPYCRIKSLMAGNSHNSLYSRYVRNDGGSYWITIIDFESGKEFNCVNAESIYLQLKIAPCKKEYNQFALLKSGRTCLVSMAGKTFHLKGANPVKFGGQTKNVGPKLQSILNEQKEKRKIHSSLRKRLLQAINNGKGKKKTTTEVLIGCNIDFFMGWLEKQFTAGMSWQNHGEWHIDHIRPCGTFNMLDSEEQKKCFHYTNCRPLWAEENLRRPKDGSDIVIENSQDKDKEK